MGKEEGHQESMNLDTKKVSMITCEIKCQLGVPQSDACSQVDIFENELMDKVSKQQRSKMNRVQVRWGRMLPAPFPLLVTCSVHSQLLVYCAKQQTCTWAHAVP